jgi:hypothetical protein
MTPSACNVAHRSCRHAVNGAVRASGRGITTQSNPLRTLVPTLRATSRHRRLTRLRSTAPPIFLDTAKPNLGGSASPRSSTRTVTVRPRIPRPCRSTRSNSADVVSPRGIREPGREPGRRCRPRPPLCPTLPAWRDLSGGDGRSPLSRSVFASVPGTRGSSAERASSAETSASSVAWLLLRRTGVGGGVPRARNRIRRNTHLRRTEPHRIRGLYPRCRPEPPVRGPGTTAMPPRGMLAVHGKRSTCRH